MMILKAIVLMLLLGHLALAFVFAFGTVVR